MRGPVGATSESPYRWVILGVSATILAVVMGQLVNGLSVYFVPLETAMGWRRGEIALINSAGLVGLAAGSLGMGFAAERFGVRPVALFGIACAGAALLAASRAQTLWQFYGLFLLAGALGGGALSAPLMALVGGWFQRAPGLAIGIAAAGQALGQGAMPFTGALLIEAVGWRGALAAQGAITLGALLPLALLLRDPPRPAVAAPLSRETPSGLPNAAITAWLAAAALFCCACMSVALMHLAPLIQGCGFAASEAGGVLFWMLAVAVAGRVAFGRIADMIGALPAYLIASGWQTLFVFGFTLPSRLEVFYVYAAIYGFGYAGVMTTLLVTVRNLAAPARRASTLGVVMAFAYLGHGLGGWQGGFFYDLTGAYRWSFANAAFFGLANLAIVAMLWTATTRPRGAATA